MINTLKLTNAGNSADVILPKVSLSKSHIDKDDTIYVNEIPDGIKLTTYRPDFAAQMDAAEEIMCDN